MWIGGENDCVDWGLFDLLNDMIKPKLIMWMDYVGWVYDA